MVRPSFVRHAGADFAAFRRACRRRVFHTRVRRARLARVREAPCAGALSLINARAHPLRPFSQPKEIDDIRDFLQKARRSAAPRDALPIAALSHIGALCVTGKMPSR